MSRASFDDEEEVPVEVVSVAPPKKQGGCATAAKWGCIVVSLPIVLFVALVIWASSGTEWVLESGRHLGRR